jgi:UPF0755 protein
VRRAVLVVVLIVLIAIAWAAVRVFQPFHGGGSGTVRLQIPAGASASDIGDLLEQRDVVASGSLFNLRARLSGKRGDLKAGTFTLKHDMSYAAAIDALTQNPEAPPVIRVTLPEGRSIGESAALVRQSGLTGSYRAAATKNPRTIASLSRYRSRRAPGPSRASCSRPPTSSRRARRPASSSPSSWPPSAAPSPARARPARARGSA